MVSPLKPKNAKERKQLFYLWVSLLVVVSVFVVIGAFRSYDASGNNSRYSQPFVHRMQPGDIHEKTYDAPGLKESDIHKYQGRGYQTY